MTLIINARVWTRSIFKMLLLKLHITMLCLYKYLRKKSFSLEFELLTNYLHLFFTRRPSGTHFFFSSLFFFSLGVIKVIFHLQSSDFGVLLCARPSASCLRRAFFCRCSPGCVRRKSYCFRVIALSPTEACN